MALPKIELPIFELKIVSVEEPIKFRPFLVKEEKLLLMALQSSDNNEIMKTIKQVINNCLLSKIDIDKIPIFDIESNGNRKITSPATDEIIVTLLMISLIN